MISLSLLTGMQNIMMVRIQKELINEHQWDSLITIAYPLLLHP